MQIMHRQQHVADTVIHDPSLAILFRPTFILVISRGSLGALAYTNFVEV